MPAAKSTEIVTLYASHPTNAKNILARLAERAHGLEGLTARDLAEDPDTEVTDQNHVGGLDATLGIAKAAGITQADRVLDVGSGIGGPARVLAATTGCTVHGIDLSPARHRDAVELTRLVGLEDRVTFENEDFNRMPLDARYSVVVGQGTFVHFGDLPAALERCRAVLTPGGRIAIEDSVLAREPVEDEVALVADLERIWLAKFYPLSHWRALLEGLEMEVTHVEQMTGLFRGYFQKLLDLPPSGPDRGVARERRGWALAVQLADAGVVDYRRLVARR